MLSLVVRGQDLLVSAFYDQDTDAAVMNAHLEPCDRLHLEREAHEHANQVAVRDHEFGAFALEWTRQTRMSALHVRKILAQPREIFALGQAGNRRGQRLAQEPATLERQPGTQAVLDDACRLLRANQRAAVNGGELVAAQRAHRSRRLSSPERGQLTRRRFVLSVPHEYQGAHERSPRKRLPCHARPILDHEATRLVFDRNGPFGGARVAFARAGGERRQLAPRALEQAGRVPDLLPARAHLVIRCVGRGRPQLAAPPFGAGMYVLALPVTGPAAAGRSR